MTDRDLIYTLPEWVIEIRDELEGWRDKIVEDALRSDPEKDEKRARVLAFFDEQQEASRSFALEQIRQYVPPTNVETLERTVSQWVQETMKLGCEEAMDVVRKLLRGSFLLQEAERLDREASEDWS